MQEIQNTKNEIIARLADAKTPEEVENIRVLYLGRHGKLTLLVKNIKEVPQNERAAIGKVINEAKETIDREIKARLNGFKSSARKWFDPTIPGDKTRSGHLHLISQTISEIAAVFEKIGFTRVRYPEVEWDYFSFEALNFDKMHPARDDWETFFIDEPTSTKYGPMLLTPHTSSGQVREMLRVKKPPIRMINIAKCYRRQSDASHAPMFHQFEGLVVDRGISIVHLRGTLDHFARSFFGPGRSTRIRPYNFPFTEPSFEVDISCGNCLGKGKLPDGSMCKLCKEGWLEIGGCGMVHPNVLSHGKINPEEFTGFAFGWGVERVLLMKSGLKIPDLRLLYSTDLRFLEQF